MEYVSPFVTGSSGIGHFALLAGLGALGLSLVLTMQIVIMRVSLIHTAKHRVRIKQDWRPFITQVISGEEPIYKKISKQDYFMVLDEFNHVFGVIRGKELDSLRSSFQTMFLPVSLRKLIRSKSIKYKLYGLVTLGNMANKNYWSDIKTCLLDKRSVISLAAARALVLLDPHKAVNEIVPIILDRKEWPWVSIAHILKLAGPKLVCEKLADYILTADLNKKTSLLRLFDILKCEAELPITRFVMEQNNDEKVASVCLHISQDPHIIGLARAYLKHPRWHVRMHAATAVGRFGDESDIPLLVEMLKDKEWWVRYRSAQALVSLPGVDGEQLYFIKRSLSDRFARTILAQVISEAGK